MAQPLEKRLDNLMHEIKSIRSELILKDTSVANDSESKQRSNG